MNDIFKIRKNIYNLRNVQVLYSDKKNVTFGTKAYLENVKSPHHESESTGK